MTMRLTATFCAVRRGHAGPLLNWAEESQTEAARVAQADGPDYRRCEPQPNRLPAAVADDCPLVHLSPWNMYRDPGGCPQEFDLDLFGESASLEFPGDLLGHRFAFSLSASSEVVTRWHVRRDRLPDDKSLAVEPRRPWNISIQGDQAHLPLVRVRAASGPGYVSRRREEDRLLLVGIERARAPPNHQTRRPPVITPGQKLCVAMPLERLVVHVFTGHVRDRFTHGPAGARPGRRCIAGLESKQLAEHGNLETAMLAARWRDDPARRSIPAQTGSNCSRADAQVLVFARGSQDVAAEPRRGSARPEARRALRLRDSRSWARCVARGILQR